MNSNFYKLCAFIAAIFVTSAAIFIYSDFKRTSENSVNSDLKISTSTVNLEVFSSFGRSPAGGQEVSTTSEDILSESTAKIIKPESKPRPEMTHEVSSKSFEELINSSIIQLYCGYLNNEKTTFSDISRGTGIIINEKGEILTNRHIIYEENSKKTRNDCFVLKSPFPNSKSENPKWFQGGCS